MIRVIDHCKCGRHHRNAIYFARCAWPGVTVSGRGQIAIVVTCPDARVFPAERVRWAYVLLAELNVFGCGPGCDGAHELVAIDHDGPIPAPALRAKRPSQEN